MLRKILNVVARGREINLSDKFYIKSNTDSKGIIRSVNPYFIEVSGYTKEDLVGANHNIIRHNDMPKAVFRLMWRRLKEGQSIRALVKNRTKDENFYWVITKFSIFSRGTAGENYSAFREKPTRKTIKLISEIYKEMLTIEKASPGEKGIIASETHLNEKIKSSGFSSYDDFINSVCA